MHRGIRPLQSRSGKMVVPLLGILATLALAVAGAAIYFLIDKGERLQAVQRDLQLAEAENTDLKARIESVQQQKSRAEEELASVQRELEQSKDELAKSVQSQETLTRSVEDREREIGRLTKDLEQARGDVTRSSNQLAKLQTERDDAARKVADLEQAKADLETKLMAGDQPTVELDKVMVSGADGTGGGSDSIMPVSSSMGDSSLGGSALSAPAGDGQVVVVNREYDFIVMNLGKNHGLAVGQEFQIVRGSEVLGRVKVEKVYDELSAAAILPDSKKSSIREGDTVRSM